jgi:hypothetical protein
LAHREMLPHRKIRSQSGYGRHDQTCCWLDVVATYMYRFVAAQSCLTSISRQPNYVLMRNPGLAYLSGRKF